MALLPWRRMHVETARVLTGPGARAGVRGAPRAVTAGDGGPPPLPPSVARVAERTRLSADLLAAILEVDERSRVTLDDIERADALAERLLARRRQRALPVAS